MFLKLIFLRNFFKVASPGRAKSLAVTKLLIKCMIGPEKKVDREDFFFRRKVNNFL